MMSLTVFFISITLVLILAFIKKHMISLSPDVYILKKENLHFSNKERIRIISNKGIIFNKKQLKCVKIRDSGNILTISGNFKDGNRYDFQLEYGLKINNKENTLKDLYQKLNHSCLFCDKEEEWYFYNNILLHTYIKERIAYIVNNILKDKTQLDLLNRSKKEEILKEISRQSQNITDTFIDFIVIQSALFVIKENIFFEEIPLDYEKLSNAGYNEQQINQILKASEKNIYLNNINPLVPSEIFRKIRNIYNETNEILENYLCQLKLKNKTNNEIEEICEKILIL